MKPTLYYCGQPGDGFGWGVANTNIIRALGEFCAVETLNPQPSTLNLSGPVFMPVPDSTLKPGRKIRAPRTIGYCFTEWPITHDAPRHARAYDVLFAGSEWNVRRLELAGVKAEVLHQGIDFERFTVQPPSKRKGFVVFSGGKFEFRKGQDIVIAALRLFLANRADTCLMTAWHNQWPASMATMQHSWLLDNWENWLAELPKDRVVRLPPMPNEKTPGIYAQAHVGVFPNRCEAGTNLVMCEFMACGRPVIATNATGHADVFSRRRGDESLTYPERMSLVTSTPTGPFLINEGTTDPAGWFNCNVSDVLAELEYAYQHQEELEARGLECRRLVEKFTWRACALKIARAAFPDHEFAARDLGSQSLQAA